MRDWSLPCGVFSVQIGLQIDVDRGSQQCSTGNRHIHVHVINYMYDGLSYKRIVYINYANYIVIIVATHIHVQCTYIHTCTCTVHVPHGSAQL